MTFPPERRPRVVIADDHPSVLVAFARMLQPCCDVVASVANGQEAIDAVARLKPDILLVDLMLPDLDGLEVCRRVKVRTRDRRRHRHGVRRRAGRGDAMQEGASAFVPKHSAASTLERTIQRIFAERQRTREPVD